MTVHWNQTALDDRTWFLENALERAIALPDPQIYAAALEQDEQIEAEGNTLDGVATYQQGPLPDSHLYTTHDGRFVILYRHVGKAVEIERVQPSRSDWKRPP
jgi:hypothetical protein